MVAADRVWRCVGSNGVSSRAGLRGLAVGDCSVADGADDDVALVDRVENAVVADAC